MSAQTSSSLPPLVLEQVIRFLTPFFTDSAADLDNARAEIIETLQCYGARTRSQMLNAAQIIAFSMSALDTLGDAKTAEMSLPMRLRFRSCANSLNRSGRQNEKLLASRLAEDQPEAVSATNHQNAAEAMYDLPDPQMQEALRHAQDSIIAYRKRLSAARSATDPQPAPSSTEQCNRRPWGGAMMESLANLGIPKIPASASAQGSPQPPT